jgi:glucans biosynthesis protein
MNEKMVDPMHPSLRMVLSLFGAPRCLARTRSGAPCQSPRVQGRNRCRMHGGGKDSGGPKGSRHGRYQHGQYTYEAIEERRRTRALIAQMRAFVEDIGG